MPSDSEWTKIRRLQELGSPVVSDALRDLGHPENTALPGIVPVNRTHACAGPVQTGAFRVVTDDEWGDFLPLARFIDSVEPGAVLVLASAPDAVPGALWGEICSAAALAHGAGGVVLDGHMRDEIALADSGLPLFSRGAYSRDTLGRSILSETGVEVAVGGVSVRPGDIVVADIDGVTFFAPDLLDTLLEACEAKAAAEDTLLSTVKAGGSLYESVATAGTL